MAAAQNDAIDVMARTLWGEARGEGKAGMEAVACVILNRAANPRWWGRDIVSVCKAPWQFSVWNPDDANLRAMQRVTTADPHFALAHEIATRAVRGQLPDQTKGADHYHANYVSPVWARGQRPVHRLGRHIFYRLAIRGPRT